MTEGAARVAPGGVTDPAAYGGTASEALEGLQSAFKAAGELIVRMEESPALLTDSGWRGEIEGALGALEGAGETLLGVAPPSDDMPKPAVYSLRRAQRHMQRAGEEVRTLVAEWRQAIAAEDAEAVQQPRKSLHRISREQQQLRRELQRAKLDRIGTA